MCSYYFKERLERALKICFPFKLKEFALYYRNKQFICENEITFCPPVSSKSCSE